MVSHRFEPVHELLLADAGVEVQLLVLPDADILQSADVIAETKLIDSVLGQCVLNCHTDTWHYNSGVHIVQQASTDHKFLALQQVRIQYGSLLDHFGLGIAGIAYFVGV